MNSSYLNRSNRSKTNRISRMRYEESKLTHNQIQEASNVRPYIISQHSAMPKNMKSKNQATEFIGSQVQPYYQTRLHRQNNDQSTQEGLMQDRVPLIKNKLHLQLPNKKPITIKKFIGQEEEYRNNCNSILYKVFSCCMKPQNDNEQFDDCDYCDRRVYKDKKQKKQRDKKHRKNQQSSSQSDQEQNQRQDNEPYISRRRIKIRQTQPINIYYQEITNQNITSNRYETHIEY